MEPILVPRPPKEAFNKGRLISDLVRNQVDHFKHVEANLPKDVQATIPQHPIITENDAARYIHAMTGYLLLRPRPKLAKTVATKTPTPIRPRRPFTLAAAATPVLKKSTAKKKSSAKKETPAAKKSRSNKPHARKTSTKRKK